MSMIRIADHVDGCWSNEQGEKIFKLVDAEWAENRPVILSFDGVRSISSSFINSAFVDLAICWGLDWIKANLKIVNSTKNTNEMIRYQVNTYTSSVPMRRFYLQDSKNYDIIYI